MLVWLGLDCLVAARRSCAGVAEGGVLFEQQHNARLTISYVIVYRAQIAVTV